MKTGSRGCIYIFDDKTYRKRVLPEFKQLVKTGETADWYDELLRRLSAEEDCDITPRIESFTNRGLSFDGVCTYLDAEFAFQARPLHKWTFNWSKRSCKSLSCPSRNICPLHQSQNPQQAADFNYLFERFVVYKCIGQRQVIGPDTSPSHYIKTLVRMGFESTDVRANFLRRLD